MASVVRLQVQIPVPWQRLYAPFPLKKQRGKGVRLWKNGKKVCNWIFGNYERWAGIVEEHHHRHWDTDITKLDHPKPPSPLNLGQHSLVQTSSHKLTVKWLEYFK